jgi:hypothetical protein
MSWMAAVEQLVPEQAPIRRGDDIGVPGEELERLVEVTAREIAPADQNVRLLRGHGVFLLAHSERCARQKLERSLELFKMKVARDVEQAVVATWCDRVRLRIRAGVGTPSALNSRGFCGTAKPLRMPTEKNLAIVSVVGRDQKGVVARVSTYLAGCSINIEDIEQRVMEGSSS